MSTFRQYHIYEKLMQSITVRLFASRMNLDSGYWREHIYMSLYVYIFTKTYMYTNVVFYL